MCKPCYTATAQGVLEVTSPSLEPNEVQVRKVGETVYGTVSSLANALEFPISILKDSARPDYWVPDHEISECAVCDKAIGANATSSQVHVTEHHQTNIITNCIFRNVPEFTTVDSVAREFATSAVRPGNQYQHEAGTLRSGSATTAS